MLAPDDEARALQALRYSLASDIVELVVLTGDESFLQTLREAVGPARRLWHVPTGDKVSDLLIAGGVGILILDVHALLDTPSVFIGQIKRQFPDLVILAAGPREAETVLAKLISEGTVYRFIHKPMSPARARLFAEAAVKRYVDLRQRSNGTLAIALPRRRSTRNGLLSAILGLAVAAGALVAWGLSHRPLAPATLPTPTEERPPASAGPLASPSSPDAQARRAAVSAAQQAQAEGALAQQLSRVLEARRPSAAGATVAAGATGRTGATASGASSPTAAGAGPEKTGTAASAAGARPPPARSAGARPEVSESTAPLAAVPTGPGSTRSEAPAGAAAPSMAASPRRAAELAALATARADEGHFIEPAGDSAQEYLRAAVKAGPRDTATIEAEEAVALKLLAAVRTAIDRRDFEQASRLLEAAEGVAAPSNIANLKSRLANAQRPQEGDRPQQLLVLARERLQQDALLEPTNDSARYYLTALRSLAPNQPGLNAATQDLDARLVTRARGELSEKHYEAARALLGQATADGYSSPDAVTVLREIEDAADKTGTGAASGGSRAIAGAAMSTGSPEVISAGQLQLVKSVQPDYPRRAAEQAAEGWVDLEFTVDERGGVKDVRVIQGQPAGYFEQSARSAVAQWRYKPVLHDGRAVMQRARVRIRFSLNH